MDPTSQNGQKRHAGREGPGGGRMGTNGPYGAVRSSNRPRHRSSSLSLYTGENRAERAHTLWRRVPCPQDMVYPRDPPLTPGNRPPQTIGFIHSPYRPLTVPAPDMGITGNSTGQYIAIPGSALRFPLRSAVGSRTEKCRWIAEPQRYKKPVAGIQENEKWDGICRISGIPAGRRPLR